MEQQVDLQSYLRVIKRRKKQFFYPAGIVFVVVAMITFMLPSIYSASSTILIEAQNIPKELVQSTVSGYVEQRLQTIAQVVLGRVSMLQLINKLALYSELRETHTTEELVKKMQKDVELTPVQADVINPTSGAAATATIAFTLSYRGKSPQVVTQVVNELTSSFLEQNLKDREQKATTAVTFLEKQRDELNLRIREKENEIAIFKKEHINELPELMQLNLQSADRLDKDIASLDEQLKALINRKVYLEGQLATIDPSMNAKGMPSPKEELDTLRREYISLKASRSAQHPDVQTLGSRIKGLELEYGLGESSSQVQNQIDAAEQELVILKEKYSDKHPDVLKAEKKLAELRARIDNIGAVKRKSVSADQPENPAYIGIKTQIASTEMEIQSVRGERMRLLSKHDAYRERLENSPQVEQVYRNLLRDLTDSQQKYDQTVSRMMAAQEALVLEKEQVAEKMTLIAPPIVPEKPSSPNRIALIVVAFVLAIGTGIGVASVAEFLDSAIHTTDELHSLTSAPVLAVIPYIVTSDETSHKNKHILITVIFVVLAIVFFVLGVHFFVRPLDVILFQMLRLISLYL